MPWEIPFVKRREPIYDVGSPPVVREYGDEPVAGVPGIPEPVRDAEFEGMNLRRHAQLFTTFNPWFGFGTAMGLESFSGRAYQPDPAAAYPYGELGVDPPRRVVARPPSRASGG